MIRINKLAAHAVASAAVFTLVASSAFADDRPSRGTNRDRGNDRGRIEQRGESRRGNGGRNDRYENNGRYDNRRGNVQYYSGRVSKYDRYRDGYRVWVHGAPYPFYVPSSRWNRSRFNVGVSIRIGGYYNPLGYYDYYDDGRYDDRHDNRSYGRDSVGGYVERVDYRNGTIVISDGRSRRPVTVVMRNRDRFFDDLRRGDYVQLSGDWDRGVFEAYRIEDVDRGR